MKLRACIDLVVARPLPMYLLIWCMEERERLGMGGVKLKMAIGVGLTVSWRIRTRPLIIVFMARLGAMVKVVMGDIPTVRAIIPRHDQRGSFIAKHLG